MDHIMYILRPLARILQPEWVWLGRKTATGGEGGEPLIENNKKFSFPLCPKRSSPSTTILALSIWLGKQPIAIIERNKSI